MGRGRRIELEGRSATLVGLVVLLGCLWAASGCVPGVRQALGLQAGYDYSLLRVGAMETEVRPGAWLIGSPRRRSSLVFASAGDRIHLTSSTSVDEGRVLITVRSGVWAGKILHNSHITAGGDGFASVTVPHTGFYTVSSNYVFGFRGAHRLVWQVD